MVSYILSTKFRIIYGMKAFSDFAALRTHRNTKLYRSLTRTLRVYNRLMVTRLRAAGFDDFSPAFPALLSNLDTEGTRIGVLATRAGVTRQAAGQLVREIERCGYVEMWTIPDDARATLVRFTARGRKLLGVVLELVEEIEGDFAAALGDEPFDRLREGLLTIADRIDPGGALGSGDQPDSLPLRKTSPPGTQKLRRASAPRRRRG